MGLSIYENAPSLLKSLDRQTSHGHRSIPARSASVENAPSDDEQLSKAPQHDDEDVYGPPLGSDDEEEASIERTSQSSDGEEAGRGDIRPTNFKVKGDMRSLPTRDTTDDDGFAPIRESVSAACSASQTKSPLRRSRRNGSDSTNSTPKKARLETSLVYKPKELDIFSIPAANPRKKPFIKYGSQSKSQGSRGSQSNSETSPVAVFRKSPQGMSL